MHLFLLAELIHLRRRWRGTEESRWQPVRGVFDGRATTRVFHPGCGLRCQDLRGVFDSQGHALGIIHPFLPEVARVSNPMWRLSLAYALLGVHLFLLAACSAPNIKMPDTLPHIVKEYKHIALYASVPGLQGTKIVLKEGDIFSIFASSYG